MKFPDFSLTWIFFIFQNVFPDRGNPGYETCILTAPQAVTDPWGWGGALVPPAESMVEKS